MQPSEVGQVLHRAMQSAGERALQHRGFVDLAEGLPDRRAGVLTVDSKRFNIPEHARAAAQPKGDGRPGVRAGGASVI